MLKELYDLSKVLKPALPVGYTTQKVDVLINVDSESITLLKTEKIKKDKIVSTQGKRLIVPSLSRNGTVPILIVDVGEYLGLDKKKYAAYLELLHNCLRRTSDLDVKKIITYLEKSNVNDITTHLKDIGAKPISGKKMGEGLRFAFCTNGDDEQSSLISNKPKIKEFWRFEYLDRLELDDWNDKKCIIAGEEQAILMGVFPEKIKGVPGGNSTGSSIVSFDKTAYQGWGFKGNDNAPMGMDTAWGVISGLDFLMNSPYHHQSLNRQMFVYWGNVNQEGINDEFWNDPESIKLSGLFKSVYSGKSTANTRPYSSEFYLGILKGNTGRIAINGVNKTTPDEIAQNVRRFLQIQESLDGKAKPIYALIKAAFLDSGDYTQRIETALIHYTLLGCDLPQEYAQKLIDRICSECHSEDNLKFFSYTLATRAKGLMLYLNLQLKDSMTPDDEIAYRLGRVAFLMHQAQVKARKQSNEDTNVLRSLKALVMTPSQVFGRLYQGCYCHHLQVEGMGYIRNTLDDELKLLDETQLPNNFNLRQQSLFMIGFAKKRAEFFTKKSETNNQEEE